VNHLEFLITRTLHVGENYWNDSHAVSGGYFVSELHTLHVGENHWKDSLAVSATIPIQFFSKFRTLHVGENHWNDSFAVPGRYLHQNSH
jgi:hypothetical protein